MPHPISLSSSKHRSNSCAKEHVFGKIFSCLLINISCSFHDHYEHSHHRYFIFTISTLIYCFLCCSLLSTTVEATKLKLCQPVPKWRFYDIASHLANSQTLASNQTNNPLVPDSKYFRSPFEQNDSNPHVTVIALISLQDVRADTDAWLTNLKHIYQNLVEQKEFKEIRFLLINSKDSYNPVWVNRVRKNVSFEVYQELSSSPISTLLDGSSGDVFIFDLCNLLAYYIRFPLSFIDQKDLFFQATILAAHSDSPCKEKCFKSNITSTISNGNETIENIITPSPMTSNAMEQTVTTTSPEQPALLSNVLSEMGEVLQNFYDRYTMTFQSENGPPSIPIENATNITSNLIETLNRTLETYNLNISPVPLVEQNVTNTNTSIIRNELISLRKVPDERKNNSKLIESCNKTICNEWTTEKLLAARLCCLSFILGDDEDGQVNEPMINVNASDYIPSNGGFGCKLYARSTCSMIKPVLQCCTKKLVNEYFNYAIKLRERQQIKFGQRSNRSNLRSDIFQSITKKFLHNTFQISNNFMAD